MSLAGRLSLRPKSLPKLARATAADYMTDDVATPNSNQQALNSIPVTGIAPTTPVAVTTSPVSAFFPTQCIAPLSQAQSVDEIATRMADLMSSVSTMGDEAFEAAFRSAFYEQPASNSTTSVTPGTPTTPTTPPTLSAPGSPKRKRESVDEEGHKCSTPTTHSSPSPTLSSTTCGASLGRSWCGASCCSAKRPCIQRYIAQTCGRYVKRQINRVPSTGCTSPTRRRSPKPRRVPSLPSLYFPPPSPSSVPTPVPVHVSPSDDCEDPADAFLAAFMSKMGIASAEEQDEDMVVEIESGSSVDMVMA